MVGSSRRGLSHQSLQRRGSNQEQVERKMETAIVFESDILLHGHLISLESGQTIYKTKGICFLY